MKVKVKLFMVYQAKDLDDTEKLLGAIKQMTNPLIFNAEVHDEDVWKEASGEVERR